MASRPTYNDAETYLWNYEHGPELAPGLEGRQGPRLAETFLGRKVHSVVGVGAGPLLNSNWILAYARLGYDLLTYKTVRSERRACHPMPNFIPLEASGRLAGLPAEETLERCPGWADERGRITSGISFGMPSMDPEVWRRDVERARAELEDGQVLIVSVTASPKSDWGTEEIAADFARCAAWAHEAGADAVEGNLSCPNVQTAEGAIYRDPETSRAVAEAMRAALGSTPLLFKIGYLSDATETEAFLRAVGPSTQGISATNGLSKTLIAPDGAPAFGAASRRVSGVGGWGARDASLENLRRIRAGLDRLGLDLELVGISGIQSAADAELYFEAGAQAVQVATAAIFTPELIRDLLAIRARRA